VKVISRKEREGNMKIGEKRCISLNLAKSYLLTSLVLIFSLRHRKVQSAYITNSRAKGSRDMPKRNAVARSYKII
jgi:hypothetical protein